MCGLDNQGAKTDLYEVSHLSGSGTVHIPDQEVTERFTMSASAIAVAMRQGNVWIWEHQGAKDKHRGKVANARKFEFSTNAAPVWGMLMSEGIVAVFDGQKRIAATVDLTVGDAKTQKVSHCAISLHEVSQWRDCQWDAIITNGQQSVGFFERMHQRFGGPGRFYHTSVSLEGKIQSHGSLQCPEPTSYVYTHHNEHTAPSSRSKIHNADVTLWTFAKHSSRAWQLTRIFYNVDKQQLGQKEDMVEYNGLEPTQGVDFFWRKDVAYTKNRQDFELSMLDVRQPALKKMPMISNDAFSAKVKTLGGKNSSITKFMGDETFLVKVCRGYFAVWCFDRRTNLAKDIPEYQTVL